MKKIVLKSLLWFLVFMSGSLAILHFNGITDLKDLHIPSMMFGSLVGFMALSINYIIPGKES